MTDRFLVDNWTDHLIPLAGSREGLTLLEIGVFDGKSSCWFLDNVLTSLDDQWIGIDSWELAPTIEERARKNVRRFGVKALVIKGPSRGILTNGTRRDLLFPGNIDIAYVNGIREPLPILIHSALVWPLLSIGGVIVWNNYRVSRGRHRDAVKQGVDAFLTAAAGKFEIVFANREIGVRKTEE